MVHTLPDDLLDRARESHRWRLKHFGSRSPMRAVLKVGMRAELVGQPVSSDVTVVPGDAVVDLESPEAYVAVDRASGYLPCLVKGSLRSVELREPVDVAVAVDGQIWATTRTYFDNAEWRFAALLPEDALHDGRNLIDVYLLGRSSGRPELARVRRSNGAGSATRDGRRDEGPPIEAALKGMVERVRIDASRALVIEGWAADFNRPKEAVEIAVFDDQKPIFAGRCNLVRSDIGQSYPSVADTPTGFRFRVPLIGTNRIDTSRVRVFASSAGSMLELDRQDTTGRFVLNGAGVPGDTLTLSYPLVADAVQGFLDSMIVTGDTGAFSGWAASVRERQAAANVVIFVEGTFVCSARPSVEREDLVKSFKSEALRAAGFYCDGRLPTVRKGTPPRVRAFGISPQAVASELSYSEEVSAK